MKQKNTGSIISSVLLGIWLLIALFPLVWMFYSSFKTNSAIMENTFSLPTTINIENYISAWTSVGNNSTLGLYLFNSLKVSAIALLMLVPVVLMAGCALGRYEFKGKVLFAGVLAFLITIPDHGVIIPIYTMMRNLNLSNSHIGLSITHVVAQAPFSVLILASFFRVLPKELEEAALIDGCNEYQKLTKIIFPLSLPAISTISIIALVSIWNDLIFSLLLITDTKLKTITQGLSYFVSEGGIDFGRTFAALAISTLPVVILFLIFQKNIIKAMAAGAVKG